MLVVLPVNVRLDTEGLLLRFDKRVSACPFICPSGPLFGRVAVPLVLAPMIGEVEAQEVMKDVMDPNAVCSHEDPGRRRQLDCTAGCRRLGVLQETVEESRWLEKDLSCGGIERSEASVEGQTECAAVKFAGRLL